MPNRITTPIDESAIRDLSVGDEVLLSGVMVTARDAAHKFMVEQAAEKIPAREWLAGGIIYHCGPVVMRSPETGEWSFVAAGPTTSIREEPYEATVIEKFGVRGVIGKGGMGQKTSEACERLGCCYFHAIGGLATTLALCVKRVRDVFMVEEFGTPEAFWVIEVSDFPAVVTMDTHGCSLHDQIAATSKEKLENLLG